MIKNTKQKGSNGERELIHMFWKEGYAALRSAGSGCSKYPCPDIISSNGDRIIAIECKVTKDNSKHFYEDKITNLEEFCKLFGAEGYIGVKFSKHDWLFFTLEDLKRTKSQNFAISYDDSFTKALTFKQLLGFF